MARLKEKYEKEVVPKLVAEFGIKNPMAIPRIVKVVCNIGIGEASRQPKLMEQALEELAAITGQKPVVR
ncbi:MAG: 50S ribosomal protein L5, partial [Thermoanaerobaculum sp.]